MSTTSKFIYTPLKGQGLVEYGLVVVLASVACIAALNHLGEETTTAYDSISNNLTETAAGGASGNSYSNDI